MTVLDPEETSAPSAGLQRNNARAPHSLRTDNNAYASLQLWLRALVGNRNLTLTSVGDSTTARYGGPCTPVQKDAGNCGLRERHLMQPKSTPRPRTAIRKMARDIGD